MVEEVLCDKLSNWRRGSWMVLSSSSREVSAILVLGVARFRMSFDGLGGGRFNIAWLCLGQANTDVQKSDLCLRTVGFVS